MAPSRRKLPSMSELLCFEAAAVHGSFTRAAEALSLSQSAVSKKVRSLEERLHVQLFEREKKRVALTAAGQQLKTQVREILAHLDHASRTAATYRGQEVLHVAVLPTVATRWLIPRLPKFVQLHPDVGLDLASRLTAFDFDDDPFDCAIQYGAPVWPKATTTTLFEEHMVPIANHEYQRQFGIRAPEDMSKAVLIQHRHRPHLWSEWFDKVGVRHEAAGRGPHFDQFSMVVRAAVAGLGVALMPRFLIEDELRIGRLKVLFDLSLRTNHNYFVAVPLKKQGDPLITQFVEWAADQAALMHDS